jgi:hypothetical protein
MLKQEEEKLLQSRQAMHGSRLKEKNAGLQVIRSVIGDVNRSTNKYVAKN